MVSTNLLLRSVFCGARQIERFAALLRGKGFGSYSIHQEVKLTLQALGRPPQLVIDVGGNRGEYAAAVRQHFQACDIVIFEPSAVNVARLTERFADDPRVRIEPHGLSLNDGDAILYSDEAGSGVASLSCRNLAHFGVAFDVEERVSLIAFDEYWRCQLNSRPIDLMKFDVEGHELQAMQGASEALRSTSVVQFEFGGCNIDSRTYFQDFYYMFNELGFEIFRITPIGLDRLQGYAEESETFMTTNFIAVSR